MHTHVAHGATTSGVGMACCDPDGIGVRSGITTVVDCGSVGVANIGVFPAHILPRAATRVICYLNVGSYAHTTPGQGDIRGLDEVSERQSRPASRIRQAWFKVSSYAWSVRSWTCTGRSW